MIFGPLSHYFMTHQGIIGLELTLHLAAVHENSVCEPQQVKDAIIGLRKQKPIREMAKTLGVGKQIILDIS